jgi:Lectin C-type domain
MFPKSFTLALRAIGAFALTWGIAACGGGGSSNSAAPAAAPAATNLTSFVKSAVVQDMPLSTADQIAVASTSVADGAPASGMILKSSVDQAFKSFKVNDVVAVPPSNLQKGLYFGFTGRVVSNDGNTMQLRMAKLEEVFDKLSIDYDSSRDGGAKIVNVIGPKNGKASFSRRLNRDNIVPKAIATTGTITAKGSDIEGDISVTFPLDLKGQKGELSVGVTIQGGKIIHKLEYDKSRLLKTAGFGKIGAGFTGDVSSTIKIAFGKDGKAIDTSLAELLGSNKSKAFEDLKYDLWGSELSGLEGTDKAGLIPLAGVVVDVVTLLSGGTTAGFRGDLAANDPLRFYEASRTACIVLWIYLDAAGEISIKGEQTFNVGRHQESYKGVELIDFLADEKWKDESYERSSPKFANMAFDMEATFKQNLGASVAVDLMVGGIRPLTGKFFTGVQYESTIKGHGQFNLVPSDPFFAGTFCYDINGFKFLSEAEAKIRLVASTTLPFIGEVTAGTGDDGVSWASEPKVWKDFNEAGLVKSNCIVTEGISLAAKVFGPDASIASNALVDIDFAKTLRAPSYIETTKRWSVSITAPGFTEKLFDSKPENLGLERVSLPLGKTYQVKLIAYSEYESVIAEASTTVVVSTGPVFKVSVAQVSGFDCTKVAVTPSYTGDKPLSSITWTIDSSVMPSTSTTTTNADSFVVTLPSCGSLSIKGIAKDVEGYTSVATAAITTAASFTNPGQDTITLSPKVATVGQLTTFSLTSLVGTLPVQNTWVFTLADCTGVTVLPGGTKFKQAFSCTPTGIAGAKTGLLKSRPEADYGLDFIVNVSAASPVCVPPQQLQGGICVTPFSTNFQFFETFDSTSLDSSKWTIAAPCCGLNGSASVSSSELTLGTGANINTKGKVTIVGDSIIIESRMVGAGGNRDTTISLVDTFTGDQIAFGDTSYASWGFRMNGSGAYNFVEVERPGGIGPAPQNATILGGSTNAYMEYRLTINGAQIKMERGPTLSNITATATRTLGKSISGQSFYLNLNTGGIYSPATYDWVRVTGSAAGGSGLVNPANGHRYEVITCGTWTQCDAAARAKGANLVTIRNAAENAWLLANVLNTSPNAMYIGLYKTGATWSWSSGEPFGFTAWLPNRPDNIGGNQNYVHISSGNQAWDDVADAFYGAATQAIVEYSPSGTLSIANTPEGTLFTAPAGASSCTFNASGTWNYGSNGSNATGPEGLTTFNGEAFGHYRILPSAQWFALLAKSGSNFQLIGATKTLSVSSGQALTFLMNESSQTGAYLDNSGSLPVSYQCQ